jgi:hypothetical protein
MAMNLGETFSHTAPFGSSAAESHRSVSILHDVDDLELIARHDKHDEYDHSDADGNRNGYDYLNSRSLFIQT